MDTNQGYKNRALASLEGKWSNGIIATLIVFLITGGVSQIITMPMGSDTMVFGTSSIWSLLCLPLSWGGTVYFLNLIRKDDIKLERLFDGYKDCVRVFLTEFLAGLAVLIGFILLIVPGFIVMTGLAQAPYIIKDDKEIGALDALKKSWEMMEGHKMEYFWLMLSFIGWFILSVLTLCFGFLFLMPYYESALAHFYEDLKAQQA